MPFLTAEWRKLLMANYIVPPDLLLPYLPWGTELDFWQGRCYVSLVGFMFMKTKVLGMSIPFHRNFEEVNLRFYVRRMGPEGWRRGVVFIKEIVPKPAISLVANTVYGEHYTTHQMRHRWDIKGEKQVVRYDWKPFFTPSWYSLGAETAKIAAPIAEGSEAEFITEHYWGYASRGPEKTNEYQVAHPRWEAYTVHTYDIQGDFGKLYGASFESILAGVPSSVFMAEGSEVSVLGKSRLNPDDTTSSSKS